MTGCLIRRRRSDQGDWDVLPINPPKDDSELEAVARARTAEHALIDEEERALSRGRGRLAPMPPVRLAIAGKLEGHKETSERNAALDQRAMAAAG